jgi:tyrosyl-tRNA synthetase
MFQERITNGEELYMHEMLYPVLQGVDSSVLAKIYGSCDLEVGGTDQLFNMLLGRDVMSRAGQEPQAVLSFEILEGINGGAKMSKSLDNYIAITDQPTDMYGKVMSIPDSSIAHYFELTTYTPASEVERIKNDLAKGGNPYDLKKRLAREIVSTYHGEEAAETAQTAFVSTFSEGNVPDDIPVIRAPFGTPLVDLLLRAKLITSTSDWRRLIEQGAVKNTETDEKITDINAVFGQNTVLKIGKRRFLRLEKE